MKPKDKAIEDLQERLDITEFRLEVAEETIKEREKVIKARDEEVGKGIDEIKATEWNRTLDKKGEDWVRVKEIKQKLGIK